MTPDIPQGSYVLTLAVCPLINPLKTGRVIVFTTNTYGRLIKKITAVRPDGVFVCSINPDGLQEDDLGIIPFNRIIGIVIKKFLPTNERFV